MKTEHALSCLGLPLIATCLISGYFRGSGQDFKLFFFAARSHQQLTNRAPPRHELEGPVQPVAELQVAGDAKAMVNCGDDVGRKNGVLTGMGTDAIAGAEDGTGADAAAGEQQAVAEIPVIPSGSGVDARRAAELPHHGHQRSAEYAPRR